MAANVTIPPEDRLYTCDVTLLEINNASILGIFTDCTLRCNWDSVNAFLPHDINDAAILGFTENRTKKKAWSVELGTVLEHTANAFVLLALAASPGGGTPADGLVSVEILRPGHIKYAGTAYVTDARFRIDTNSVIMQNGTLTGYGALART